jgi:hypothetical protein
MNKQIILLGFFSIVFCISPSAQEYVLDSVAIEIGVQGTTDFEPLFKIINDKTDNNGRIIQKTIFDDSGKSPVPYKRYDYIYDQGITTMIRISEFDNASNAFIIQREDFWTVDEGNITSRLRRKVINGDLQDFRRWLYEYDSEGNEILTVLEDYDANSASWEPKSQKFSAYNAIGLFTQEGLRKYNNGSWVPVVRRSFEYEDNAFVPSLVLEERYNPNSQSWVNNKLISYSSGNGFLLGGRLIQQWVDASESWKSEIRSGYFEVDSSGVEYIWRGDFWVNNAWEKRFLTEFHVLPLANFAIVNEYTPVTEEYLPKYRFGELWNEDGLRIRLTGNQVFNTDNESWENQTHTRNTINFWRSVSTATEEVKPTIDYCDIPNPLGSVASLICSNPGNEKLRLTIHNMQGQEMYQRVIEDREVFFNLNLLPGLYVFTITNGKELLQVDKIFVNQ